MKIYTYKRHIKILGKITSILIIIMFSAFALLSFWTGIIYLLFITIPLGLGMILFGLYMFFDADTKLLIDDETLEVRRKFKPQKIKIDDIKGYRINDKIILIIPKSKLEKPITLQDYFDDKGFINLWLKYSFINLDIVEEEKNIDIILSSSQYGINVAERQQFLKQATLVSYVFNAIGLLVGLWLLFYPKPYEYLFWAAIIIPLVSLLVMIYYKGLVKISDIDKGYPTVIAAFFFPSYVLSLRAFLDFNIWSYDGFWLPILAIALIIVVCTNLLISKVNVRKFSINAILLLYLFSTSATYTFGGMVIFNCIYDNGTPKVYQKVILDKEVSSNSSNYLTINSWENPKDTIHDIIISNRLYNEVNIGDTVFVVAMEGRLGIPWFFVEEKE
jgi:hypothetical protein